MGWLHVILVIHGLGEGQGYTVYYNGTEVSSDSSLQSTGYNEVPEPTVTVGDENGGEPLDEFVVWLEELTPEEVLVLYNEYQ